MKQKDTKQNILDAAEELFAVDGYHGTSLRTITKKAGVNLASVNYHFGSKEELVVEVLRRRLVPLNESRIKKLQKVLLDEKLLQQPVGVEAIMRSFIEPTLKFRDASPGAMSFLSLIGRALAEPDDTVRKKFASMMEPVFHLMLEGLVKALPGYPKEVLFWRLHFTIGATSHTLRCIDNVPMDKEGKMGTLSTEKLVAMLLPFVTAGMEAPL